MVLNSLYRKMNDKSKNIIREMAGVKDVTTLLKSVKAEGLGDTDRSGE